MRHVWSITGFEYDDTFFHCTNCDARTNCRRGFPDPIQGGPCPGFIAATDRTPTVEVSLQLTPSRYDLMKVDPFETKDP